MPLLHFVKLSQTINRAYNVLNVIEYILFRTPADRPGIWTLNMNLTREGFHIQRRVHPLQKSIMTENQDYCTSNALPPE